MLYLMRKYAQSWLIKIVLGVIVVVFVFWGVGSYQSQKGNRIAVVNGEPIELEEFRGVHNQLLERYRSQFGDALDEELMQRLNLKRQVLDQLINRRLLLQEATRLNLRVTDEEILRAIEQVPAFQRNGRFHPEQYDRVLMHNRMTREAFEKNQKNEFLIDKLQNLVFGSIKVSEAEALDMYRWLKDKVSLDYVLFKPSEYINIKVTPEEVETYFSKHKKAYEIPPKVKVRYLLLDFKGFEAQASVSEDEVRTHFDLNEKDYAKPKEVRASHILFKVKQGAKPEAIDKARKKALDVLEQARSGADFAGLARKYSDDPGSRDKGGDLGFFAGDRMVKPFSDAAFAMKSGEISEPVRTPFGWHIIRVEAIHEAKEPVLEEVADLIRSELVKDAARTLAFDRAEQVHEACYGAGNISDVAKINQLKVHETEYFSKHGPVKGIKEGNRLAQTAFALDENEVSEPFELSNGYYILKLISKEPARIPDLKTVEKNVGQDLIKARKDDLAKKDAEEFLSALKGGTGFQDAAASRKLKAKSTGFFERSGVIPEIGLEQEIQETAYLLSPSRPLPDTVIKGKQGYYVLQFKDRQEADKKEFEDKRPETVSRLLLQKRQKAIGELLAQLRGDSEIIIEEGYE